MESPIRADIKVCGTCLKVDIDPKTHECDLDRMMNNENW